MVLSAPAIAEGVEEGGHQLVGGPVRCVSRDTDRRQSWTSVCVSDSVEGYVGSWVGLEGGATHAVAALQWTGFTLNETLHDLKL